MPRCQDFASFCHQLPGCRLKGRSLHSLHFPPILKKIPSIQNLNETTEYGPIFMIYHNMCDGCMDVHTDRCMSRRTDEITCVTLYYPITLEWHEKKNCISVMCSVVSWSFARTRSVLNRIMLRVLQILFFSTHPLKIAKFTEMRKSNVLSLIWMMWDTLMLKLIAKK